MMDSTSEILQQATGWLKDAGVENPRNDAKMLLAEAFGISSSDVEKSALLGTPLHAVAGSSRASEPDAQNAGGFNTTGTVAADDGNDDEESAIRRFSVMLARRKSREPLQYIVGHAPFRYLDLAVGPGVFIPRPETEIVVQEAINWLNHEHVDNSRLVDLCAGSGAIGLSLVTEVQDSEVWAVEQSDEAFEWTKRNNQEVVKREPSVESRYHLVQADATIPTTLDQLDRSVDAVISNPPYVPLEQIPEQPEVRDYDPEMALYGGSADGTCIPDRIIMRAYGLLRHGGALVMEHDISQGEVLADFARTHGFCQVRTGNDLTDRSRYLFAIKS